MGAVQAALRAKGMTAGGCSRECLFAIGFNDGFSRDWPSSNTQILALPGKEAKEALARF